MSNKIFSSPRVIIIALCIVLAILSVMISYSKHKTNTVYSLSLVLMISYSIVLAILSVIYCYRPYNPHFMRIVALYCLINAGVNTVHSIFWIIIGGPDLLHSVFHTAYLISVSFFTLCELICFVWIFSYILESRLLKILLWSLAGFHLLAFTLLAFWTNVLNVCAAFEIFEAAVLLVGCFGFFRELVVTPKIVQLKKHPAFWVVLGIFIYLIFYLTCELFSTYFGYLKMHDLAIGFYSINNFAQLITYSLFIIAMLCLKPNLS